MPRAAKNTTTDAPVDAAPPADAPPAAVPKSIFKFKNKKPKTVVFDGDHQPDTSLVSGVTSVGRGPEIKAVVVAIINVKQNSGPYMMVCPYACDVPGSEGSVYGGDNGTQKIVQCRGRLGTKDIKWEDRDIIDMDIKLHKPIKMGFPKKSGRMEFMEPGTGIVLCNVTGSTYISEDQYTQATKQTEYINASYIRVDEYYSWESVLKSSSESPINMSSFVVGENGKCGSDEVTFPAIPENRVEDLINVEKDFHVATVRSVTHQPGPIGPDGTNSKDYFELDLEIVSSINGNQVNVMVNSARIYRHAFSYGFSMYDPNLLSHLGGQLLSTSNLLISGTVERINAVEGGNEASAIIFPSAVVANLGDIIKTAGRKVSSVFARKHMTRANSHERMTLDRKIILLNECAYPNAVQNLFKTGEHEFYAISNVDIGEDAVPDDRGMFDRAIESVSTGSTVHAIYAVKIVIPLSPSKKRKSDGDNTEDSKKQKTESS